MELKIKKHLRFGALLAVEPLNCSKCACGFGAKHISKSKCPEQFMFGALLEPQCSKSERSCGAKCMSKSKCQNSTNSVFLSLQQSNRHFSWHPQWILQEMSQTCWFCSRFKNDGRRGSAKVHLRGRHKARDVRQTC